MSAGQTDWSAHVQYESKKDQAEDFCRHRYYIGAGNGTSYFSIFCILIQSVGLQ